MLHALNADYVPSWLNAPVRCESVANSILSTTAPISSSSFNHNSHYLIKTSRINYDDLTEASHLAAMSSIFHDIQGSAIFAVSAAIALPIFLYVLFFSSQYEFPPKAPKLVDEGWPIIGALRFFTARWEFFQHARSHSPSGNFSFRIGKYPLIGLTGEKGREVFFENRDLGFAEGYDMKIANSAYCIS